MVAALTAGGGVAVGQADEPAQPVEVESAVPAWRDLDRALRDLETAKESGRAIQMALDRTRSELSLELGRLEQLGAVTSGKQLLMDEAQRLVVQEYMAGGDVEDLVFILGVSEATDSLWREGLLSEISEVLDEALDAVDDVSGERGRTQARIDRLQDAIPYLNSRFADVEKAVEAAEWVVYIAEINDLADRELAENGFIEPTEEQWYNLRFCESTDNYRAESANGLFYGAYQFEPRTWRTVGGTGNPAHATPEEQDARARLLYSRRGDQPWPREYCGRWLPRN